MYAQTIRKSGHKLTKPRMAVLNLLQTKHLPLSARQIHKKLKGGIDLVSVYRTLQLFDELGFLQKEESKGAVRYFLSLKPHHHIRCERCERIECVPCQHNFSKIKGFNSIKHQLTLTGICTRCSK